MKPTLALTPCPRCGKQLTEKGLRYSHKCPADKVIKQPETITQNENPQVRVIERIIEKEPTIIKGKTRLIKQPEEVIQNEIRKRMASAKDIRQIKHQDNIKRLSVNIV